MRIAIISSANVMHMTLISHYMTLIDQSKHDVDLIYLDKYNKDEFFNATNIYKYKVDIKQDDSKLIKLHKYCGFKKFVKKIVNSNEYDFFIVWNSYTAQLLGPNFFKKIKGKYFLNIRDYTYEKNPIIFKRIESIIENSIFTTISSKGFYTFLPPSKKYVVLHSINSEIVPEKKDDFMYTDLPINISFIGNVRFYEQNKKLIEAFKNRDDFKLHYYGVGSEPLAQYCKENKIENVYFHGAFSPNKTLELLNNTDILNNYYGNDSIALTTAISIRMYYAIYLLKPIITTPNTYTSDIANKVGIGFSEEITTDYPEKLKKWHYELDRDVLIRNRDNYINEVEYENDIFRNKFKGILNK